MDEAGKQHADDAKAQWKSPRAEMLEDCHHSARYRKDQLSGAQVCPQQRFSTGFIYTDDPIFIVVGARRTIRAIKVRKNITIRARLKTAIPEKRSLGSWT
ncbi:MAG: hypothetical protein SGPRY_014491, partial [Prymnesium sp.]